MTVLLRGPGGEFELPFDEAVFGGPAKRESRNYWLRREGAVDVLVPHVSRFGEKNKTTGEQGWEDVPAESALEGLLLPQPPGKEYRLLKIVTQPATPEQLARFGNERAPRCFCRRAQVLDSVAPRCCSSGEIVGPSESVFQFGSGRCFRGNECGNNILRTFLRRVFQGRSPSPSFLL